MSLPRKTKGGVPDLRNGERLKHLKNDYIREAVALGLVDDYDFVTTFNCYDDQLKEMQACLQRKDEDGNPCPDYLNYNKLGTMAVKYSAVLRQLIADKRREKPPEDDAADGLI